MGSIVNQMRYKGFEEAHKTAGVMIDDSIIFTEAESNVVIENCVEQLIREKVDCILCMDDSICAQAITKCMKDNISIPDDIRIASFYNSSLLDHSRPAITSLQFDVAELGMKSCSLAIAAIEKDPLEVKTLLGYQVVMKESTAS